MNGETLRIYIGKISILSHLILYYTINIINIYNKYVNRRGGSEWRDIENVYEKNFDPLVSYIILYNKYNKYI